MKHLESVFVDVAQQPTSLFVPLMMTSIPTSIVFLKWGRLILYKSSLIFAFICFSNLENTPIYDFWTATDSFFEVINCEGTPPASRKLLIIFLWLGSSIMTTTNLQTLGLTSDFIESMYFLLFLAS